MMTIDKYQDIIDVRDIIEEYESVKDAAIRDEDGRYRDEVLAALLSELKGNGGDHQWEGDWYPVTLIRDSYFTEYAQELADDLLDRAESQQWPLYCIDWERASSDLQMDYTSVEFDGITYWYR